MFVIFLAVLLIGFCWAFGHLSLLPASAVLVLDSLATAFRWIGVTDPALGWLLLGVLGGAMMGAFVGLRRAGRAVTARHFGRLSAVVAAAMLVAGNRLPERGTRTATQPTVSRPAPVVIRHVYVATEHASVRAWPGAGATVLAQLPGRSRLDALRTSDDGAWWYVQARGSRAVSGWVRRSALADGVPLTAAGEVAPPSTEVVQQRERSDTLGGEVALSRVAPRATENAAARPRVDSSAPIGGRAAGDEGAARASGSPQPTAQRLDRPADRPAESADRTVVADVQTRLAEARAGVGVGDYAAALRALAGADESVAIAAAKYGDAGWLATLRREATTVRASTRASCQAASAQAVTRGEAPPRCE